MNPLSRLLRSRQSEGHNEKIEKTSLSNDLKTEKGPEWMQLAKDISGIVVSLGAAVGIMGSAVTYILTEKAKHDEAQKTQLTTYKSYGAYLSLYRSDIQPLLGRLLRDKERQVLEQDALTLREEGKAGSSESCTRLIRSATTRTGFEVFSSPNYKTYRDIHNYYESIGYALSQGQLDFEIIFDLITLPNYWNIHDPSSSWYKASDKLSEYRKTRTYLYPDFSVMLPLRSCIGDNYFGLNMPLHDFSDSIDTLGYNYLFARMRSLYSRECWNKDGDKHSSNAIYSILSSEGLSGCDILRKRLLDMRKTDNKPARWMTLYTTTPVDIDPSWSMRSLLRSPTFQSSGRDTTWQAESKTAGARR